MAQQRDMNPAQLLGARSFSFARLVSQVFHPILMNILTFVIAGYYGLANHVRGLAWTSVCIVGLIVPPTIFYAIRLKQGIYGDEDVSIRQQRNELYMFGFGWMLLMTVVLMMVNVPAPLLAVTLSALVMGVLGGVINLFWKISVHAGSIAAVATIALLYTTLLGVVLWMCALLVGWARVRTHNHTLMQVSAGMGLAAIVVVGVFHLVSTYS